MTPSARPPHDADGDAGTRAPGAPAAPPDVRGAVPPSPPLYRDISADDTRRMLPTYAAVVIVETVVLLAVWWFQEYFS